MSQFKTLSPAFRSHAKLSFNLPQVGPVPLWDLAGRWDQSRLASRTVTLRSVTLLIALIASPLVLLTLCFALELFIGSRSLQRGVNEIPATTIRSAIIVPAHNEQLVISATLEKLQKSPPMNSHILVVADNCGDGTAKIATNIGVEVIERNDPARRGKGFALDFARAHLSSDPPDVVVIFDADCAAGEGSIERLVSRCAESGSPCQAKYVLTPTPNASPALQLSAFAFYIKNVVRQRAIQRLAGRGHLLGTGMAFPWPLFEKIHLATANIVEDLEIGLDLAEAGHPALAVEDAEITSAPASAKDTLEQRRRWEGGYLATAARRVPRMLARSLARGDFGGLWAALDLLIPPLALLILLDVAVLCLAALAVWLAGAAAWPPLVLGATLGLAGIALAIAWATGGSRYVTLGALARIPAYIVWKLPLYLGLARHGAPKEWLRTERAQKAMQDSGKAD